MSEVDRVDEFIRALGDFYSLIELYKREAEIPMPKRPQGLTDTERVLIRMMTEAHVHILDSGGAYGRNWESRRRQWAQIDPRGTPSAWMNVDRWGFYVHIDTFQYLRHAFERDRKVDIDFHRFANSPKWKKESWWDCLYAWAEERGYEVESTFNTYNDEYDLVNQVLQGVIINLNPDEDWGDWLYADPDDPVRVWLQTHNGCDIRGGYSEPHIFRPLEELDYAFYSWREEANILIFTPKTGRCVGNIYYIPDGLDVYIHDDAPLSLRRLNDEIPDDYREAYGFLKDYVVEKNDKPYLKAGRVYYPLKVYAVWE